RRRAGDDHVVGELVLHDDLGDVPGGALREAEAQHVLERVEPGRRRRVRQHLRRDAPHRAQLSSHLASMTCPGRTVLLAIPGISVAAPDRMRALVPIGRVLFALIFVASIVGHFSSTEISEASAHGVPLAMILVPLAGILALLGGLSVMLGFRARFGALLLV